MAYEGAHMVPRLYPLQCGHAVRLFPKPGKFDLLYCASCDEWLNRAGVTPEYRYLCDTCYAGRSFGQARLNSELGASRHWQKYPTHTVTMFYGGQVRGKIEGNTGPLLAEGEIPF